LCQVLRKISCFRRKIAESVVHILHECLVSGQECE
jgi:hypothetical protein